MQINSVQLVSIVNFFMNFAIQGSLIFIPLLGAQMGASDFQVGLIGACYGGSYLLSSLYFGRQSDRSGRLGFVRIGLLLCAITFAAQLLANQIFTLALVRAGVGLALGVATAALVAYAFESGANMGRYSSYGSLGWIAGALLAAYLNNIAYLFAVSSLCCTAAFFISLRFPGETGGTATQASAPKTQMPSFKNVFKRGWPIYLAVFLRHLGAAAVWIILPLYFISLGLDRFWVGILWGINFAVQFIVMRHLERFNPNSIFAFGQVLSIGVFIAYTLVDQLWLLMIVQVMLGVTWSCLYVGALLLVLKTGEDKGTASGIFQATLNLCNAVGPFLGGIIAHGWGYNGVMVFAAALGAAGLITAIPRAQKQQPVHQ
ncbi:MFS transporter [Desulfoscipio gibsoniae]|uniref:Arabinose efflux permease family protein n=1 Tax=Desulfoscipio gibsoniae DSM 7213 TaxID=767817 RepID=R4KHM4_9FIRM|nr:MFS transporter [Desulfoscipio gibsoniae]AGL02109.1 arabinose efflux permease family protein [Desulfoscipio gibsoniae DSM 7213]